MDTYSFFLVSLYTSTITYFIPVVIWIIHVNRQPAVFNWLAICLLFSFLAEAGAYILYNLGINPNITSNAYTLLSTFTISIFFYHAIQWKSLVKSLIVVNILYLSFAIVNSFLIQKSTPNSYTFTFQSIIIIILSLVFFFKLLKELPTFQVQKDPLFWVVSGFLFSYAGKLVIQSVTHYLIHIANDNLVIVWTMHNILTIVGNMIIMYGVYIQYLRFKQEGTNPKFF